MTDCYIQTPEGGEVVDDALEDGNGNYAGDVIFVGDDFFNNYEERLERIED